MATSRNLIISWFKTGLKPSEIQFKAAWESFWHKDEEIPASSIQNFDDYLSEKADLEAFQSHINNNDIHVSNDQIESWNSKLGQNDVVSDSESSDNKIPNLGLVKNLIETETSKNVDYNLSTEPTILNYTYFDKEVLGVFLPVPEPDESGDFFFNHQLNVGTYLKIKRFIDPSYRGEVDNITVSNDLEIIDIQNNSFKVVGDQNDGSNLQINGYCYLEYVEAALINEGVDYDVIGTASIGIDI